jgi:hypothetical protein
MNLQQLNWKTHLSNAGITAPSEWFKVFNTWIPDGPEVFIDVTDYRHVGEGPVILLAGHKANFSLDQTGMRMGLLYDMRQPLETSNADKLKSTLKRLLEGAARLEDDATFAERPVFDAGDLKLVVNNRAVAANTEANFSALKDEATPLLDAVLGAGNYSVSRDLDPKQRLALNIKAKGAVGVKAALAKLG